MTLIKPVLIGLFLFMLLVGGVFLVLYFKNKKTINMKNEKEVRNQQLNLYLSILILVGALLVGSFLFIIY